MATTVGKPQMAEFESATAITYESAMLNHARRRDVALFLS